LTANDRNSEKTPLLDKARRFFEGVGVSSKLKEQLAKVDHRAQFVPLHGSPFFVEVHNGELKFGAEQRFSKDVAEGLYIVEVSESFEAIFRGDLTLGEAIFHQKVRIPGYRNKEPAIASFSRLLRLGVWGLVPGASILMPVK